MTKIIKNIQTNFDVSKSYKEKYNNNNSYLFIFYLQYDDLQVRLAAPYQLQPKPEASDLGFGKYFTDHMLKINYFKQLGGWQKPEIIPFEYLSIHPAAKALHYAIQVRRKTHKTSI